MVHKIAIGALVVGFILANIHWYYKHFVLDRPAPELLIAIIILAVPVVLIAMGKIKVVSK